MNGFAKLFFLLIFSVLRFLGISFLVISFLVISFPSLSFACMVNPFYQTAIEYEQRLETSNFVFFGKLEKSKVHDNKTQEAKFTVIKTFKGNAQFGDTIIVTNKLGSSCSRIFSPEGTAFYVFANQLNDKSYIVGHFASFVPLSVAIETDMKLR